MAKPAEKVNHRGFLSALVTYQSQPSFENVPTDQETPTTDDQRLATMRKQYETRLESMEKSMARRLKQAEDMLEAQQNMTLAMERDAAQKIQVLREKLRRSRQAQAALSKSALKVRFGTPQLFFPCLV